MELILEAINKPLLYSQYKKLHPESSDNEIDRVIDLCVLADPTINKKYVSWIFREVLNNRIRLPEDTQVVLDNLSFFDNNKPAIRRIGKSLDITSYIKDNLWVMINDLKGENLKSKRQELIDIKREGAERLYNDNEWLIIKLSSGEACSYYGKGTKWCTADAEVAEGYLERGPLYVIYRNGKVYGQLHINSNQFMNPLDIDIKQSEIPNDLKEILANVIKEDEGSMLSLYKILGIRKVYKKYGDGYKWEFDNDNSYIYLVNDKGEDILRVIYEYRAFINIEMIERGLGNFEIYKDKKFDIKEYISYIFDILIGDLFNEFKIFYGVFNLSFLSKEQKEELFRRKPDFIKGFLFSIDNNYWFDANEDSEYYKTYKLLDNNLRPIIFIYLRLEKFWYIVRGQWYKSSNIGSLFHNQESYKINKDDFSVSIRELIFRKKISYIDLDNYGNFSFDQLRESDKKIILENNIYFNNPLAYNLVHNANKADALKIVKGMFDNNKNYNYVLSYVDESHFIMAYGDRINIESFFAGKNLSNNFFSFTYEEMIDLNRFLKKTSDLYSHIFISKGKITDYLAGINKKNAERIDNIPSDKKYNVVKLLEDLLKDNIIKLIGNLLYSYLLPYNDDNFSFSKNSEEIILLSNFSLIVENADNLENIIKLYKSFVDNVKKGFDKKEFINSIKSLDLLVINNDELSDRLDSIYG